MKGTLAWNMTKEAVENVPNLSGTFSLKRLTPNRLKM